MDVKGSSDEGLLDALRSKSLEALDELYERYHRLALAVAYRVLGDQNLAEDVIQEAFLAVWRQPESFSSGRGTVRSWFLSIVRHRAIDVTRGKSYSRERISLDEIVYEPRYPDTWQHVSQNLDRENVRQAVNELPNEQRETIMMAYFAGHTQSEISERTGVPLGTVKGRMRLAMSKLKGMLEEAQLGESN